MKVLGKQHVEPKAPRQEENPFGESELEVGQKGLSEGSASCWKLNWDCSRDENNLEEGDVMDWLEDDDMTEAMGGSQQG